MDNLAKVVDISSWKATIIQHPIKGSLALLGLITFSKSICECAQLFYRRFLRPARVLQERYGDCWALITDTSDVVGSTYALLLGKKFNLLILHQEGIPVDQDIVAKVSHLGSKVVAMPVDYREGYGSKSLRTIQEFFADKQIGLIVINQLNLIDNPRLLKKSIPSEKNLFFQESIVFPLLLLRYLTPIMLRREKKSGIIALSHQYISPSSSSLYELIAKSFLEAFLRSLRAEYRGRLDAIHFEVGSVIGLKKVNPMPFFALPPNVAVKGQLAAVGYEKKSSGHWKHYLEKYLTYRKFNK